MSRARKIRFGSLSSHSHTHLHGVCVCVCVCVCVSFSIHSALPSLTHVHTHSLRTTFWCALPHPLPRTVLLDRPALSLSPFSTSATDQRDRPARPTSAAPPADLACCSPPFHADRLSVHFRVQCRQPHVPNEKPPRSLQTALQTTQSGKSRHDSSGGHLFGRSTISHRSRTCSHWDRRRGVTTFRNETDLTSQLSRHDGMTGFVSG